MTKSELIDNIKLDAPNISEIASRGKITGKLRKDILRIMDIYANQAVDRILDGTADELDDIYNEQ